MVGKFRNAGGNFTGPMAYFNQTNRSWRPVGNVRTLTWSMGAYINDISVDCSTDPVGDCVACDVFVGGSFVATIASQPVFALNVLRWNSAAQDWDPMAGNPDIGQKEVFAITKKDSGNPFASNNVWVGGTFKSIFTKYDVSTNQWGKTSFLPALQGAIYAFYYKVCFSSYY